MIRWETGNMFREKVFRSRELPHLNVSIRQRTNHLTAIFEETLTTGFQPDVPCPFLMTILPKKCATKKLFGFLPEGDCILWILISTCLTDTLFKRIYIDPEARLICEL
ncbi:hypothetical protein KSD_77170 [Ktedonobacter sp. SOSP1-85]|nr:hypothetical protein KSD_77170 [Ktedonobacter sp. SOSP1-85]